MKDWIDEFPCHHNDNNTKVLLKRDGDTAIYEAELFIDDWHDDIPVWMVIVNAKLHYFVDFDEWERSCSHHP